MNSLIQITAGQWSICVPLTLKGIEVANQFLELLKLVIKEEVET